MARKQWFYGWVVVASVFIVTFVGYGLVYSFAAFFPSLQAEFNATRGTISLFFSLSGFLYFSIGAATGPLADRVAPRWVVTAGMIFLGAGLVLASQAQTLWQACAAYGAGVGLGVGFIYVPAIGTVQKWFVVRRGLATALAVAGIGMGTLVMPIATGMLIEATNWRQAYLLLALLPMTAGIGGALLLEGSPERRGLLPDGGAPARPEAGRAVAASSTEDGPAIRVALASLPFWLIYAASFLSGLGLYTPVVHLASYARDHGLSEHTGLWLVGLLGVGSAIGRFAMGGIADWLGRRRSLTAVYAWMALLLVGWLASTTIPALAAFALLFGLGWGGYVALFPALSADYFGGRNGIGIFGLLITNLAFGTLIGPALAGFAFDATGSYALPIMASAAANLAAAGCMLLLESSDRWRARIACVAPADAAVATRFDLAQNDRLTEPG